MTDDRPKLTSKARLRVDPLTGVPLLLFPEGVLRLNTSAAEVLALCDGRNSIPTIMQTLASRFNIQHADVVQNEVRNFLAELHHRRLVTNLSPSAQDRPLQNFDNELGGEGLLPRPLGLLAELTYRCPLRCPYCSNPTEAPSGPELDTGEWTQVLAQAADLGVLHVHFSGGEPLLRSDLVALVSSASAHGLYTNLLTSGIPLTAALAKRLREAGLDHVQISLQADTAAGGDAIAGIAVHAEKLAAAQLVRASGWPLTINVVLHRDNIARVPELVAVAEQLGADRLELANVQFHGWRKPTGLACCQTERPWNLPADKLSRLVPVCATGWKSFM